MKFQYRAKDRSGNMLSGELEAESLADARALLKRQGVFILSCGTPTVSLSRPMASATGKTVRGADLVTMMTQMTIMCQSGMSLAESLHNLAEKSKPGRLRDVIVSLDRDVNSGVSFSGALRKHPRVFDESFVAGIVAGEQTGNLVDVLERLSTLLRNEKRLRNSIISLLTYPFLLCCVTGMVVTALVFFVLPQFGQVFDSFGHAPPPITQLLLSCGMFARAYAVWLAITAIVAAGGAWFFCTLPIAGRIRDSFLINAVVVRNATRLLATGRCFHLLGAMLQSGVPLLDCIRLCRSSSKSFIFRNLFDNMEKDLMHGQGISQALELAPFLPSGAAQMVATAERSGRLGTVLQTIGQHFEEEGENAVRGLVKILEPALIVGLGIVVAGVVLSVMLPLFDASTMVH
jgi:type II secretory pathway component PulF